MPDDTSQSRWRSVTWGFAVFFGILNVGALLFGSLLLASSISDVNYGRRSLEGMLGIAYVGGFVLLVEFVLLVPATIFFLSKRFLPLWFQIFLLLALVIGITTNIVAIGHYW